VHELISNYQKLCRFSVNRLEHYTAAKLSTDIATQPPERLCVRVTVTTTQVFTVNHPIWSALPFPTDKEWLDMGMRFFEPALAAPISITLVEDAARGSTDASVPHPRVEHTSGDAPMPQQLDTSQLSGTVMPPTAQHEQANLLARQVDRFTEQAAKSASASRKRPAPHDALFNAPSPTARAYSDSGRGHSGPPRPDPNSRFGSNSNPRGKGTGPDMHKGKGKGKGEGNGTRLDNGKGKVSDRGYGERERSRSPSRTSSSDRASSDGRHQRHGSSRNNPSQYDARNYDWHGEPLSVITFGLLCKRLFPTLTDSPLYVGKRIDLKLRGDGQSWLKWPSYQNFRRFQYSRDTSQRICRL
jgi:hypothetical protein